MYQIVADLHTHSIASTHAYSTIKEMAVAAKEKGLKALAITDHAQMLPGAPGPMYFSCLAHTVPLYYQDVLCIAGIEANVIDFEGTIDVDPHDMKRLDWVVASIHRIGLPGLKDADFEKSTHLWTQVAKNPNVHVIGHSGDPEFKYDYEKVIPLFGENGKLVEINAHTYMVRKENWANCKQIALACKRHGVQIAVNSDAHIETDVGNIKDALDLLAEIDFPEELIINASMDRLQAYLEKYSTIFTRRVDNRQTL